MKSSEEKTIPVEKNEDLIYFNQELAKSSKLSLKQEYFCQLYATNHEFFGNGVQSYLMAYNPLHKGKNPYNVAKACAYEHLTNPYILERINEIQVELGFSDEFADKQLAKLMTQDGDLKAKLGALKEFNALKGRITKKLDLTSLGESIRPDLNNPAVIKNYEALQEALENNS